MASMLDAVGCYNEADAIDQGLRRMAGHALGEWWIYPDGSTEFADGDASQDTPNHDMVASNYLFGEMGYDIPNPYQASTNTGYLPFENEVPYTTSEANTYFWDSLSDVHATGVIPAQNELLEYYNLHGGEDNFDEFDCIEYLAWKASKNITDPQERQVTYDNLKAKYQHMWDGIEDARAYVIKHHGWHRLIGNIVETWSLTPETCSQIASGLEDAFEERADDMLFNIEILYPTRKYLEKIPLEEIASGKVMNRLKEMIDDVPHVAPRKQWLPFYGTSQGG